MKKQIYQFFLVFLLLLTAQLSRAECPEVMVKSHTGFEQIISNSEVEAKACEVVTALNITSTEIPLVLIYNWYPLHHFQDKEKGYEVLNERAINEHADDPYCLMIIKEHHEGGKLVFRTHLKLPDFGPSAAFDAIEQEAIATLVHQAIVSNAEENGNLIAKSYLADIAGMNELLALISRQKEIDNPFLLAGFKELEVDGTLEWQVDNTTSLDGPFIYDYAGVKTVDGAYIRTLFQEALGSQPSSPAIIITSNLVESFEVAHSNFNDLTQKLICWFHYEYIEESNSYKIYYNLRDNFTEEEALAYMDEEYENALEAYWATDTSIEDPTDTDTDTDTDLRRNRTSDFAKSGDGTGSYDCSKINCDALDIKWRAYCCILDWRPDHFNYGLAAGLIDGLLETVNFAQEASKIVMKGLTAAPLTLPWHADLLKRAWKERSFWRAFKNKIEDDVTFYDSMIASMFNLINNGKAIAQGIANAVQGWLHDLQIQSGLAKTGYAVGKLAFEIILEYFTGGAATFRKVSKFTSHAFKQLASLTDVGKVSAKARGWFDDAYSGSLFRRTDRAKILKFQILAANCFLTGTPILADHQAINIEDIVLGQLVATHKWVNNTQEIYTASQDFVLPTRRDIYTSNEQKALDKIELNQEPWYKLSLEVQKNNKEKSSIYLLRPQSWVKKYKILGKGSEIWLSLPEQNIHGDALVIDKEEFLFPTANIIIDSASNFELQPVTGIFVNTSNDVWRLIFDTGDTLKVTSAHPLFSLDDKDWQMVSELSIGEKVLTQQGHCRLLERSKIMGRHTVYNLEVRKYHNFCVGTSGIVAHNAYKIADLKKLRKRATDDPTFITDKDKDNIHLKTVVEMDEPSFKQFLDDVGEGGKIRVELANAHKVLKDIEVPVVVRRNVDNLDNINNYLEKAAKFKKQQNALLVYEKTDGTHFMTNAASFPDLNTGLANQKTFSYQFNGGPNAGSKDVYGKIGFSDDGYLVGNIVKSTGMNNALVTKVTEDAMDMALKEFGGIGNVKGVKAQWVQNPNLYPGLPDNKSINLIMFEEALETMSPLEAVFQTITGSYAKKRIFHKVKEINRLTEAVDGVNGYEVIFELPK